MNQTVEQVEYVMDSDLNQLWIYEINEYSVTWMDIKIMFAQTS